MFCTKRDDKKKEIKISIFFPTTERAHVGAQNEII